MHEPNHLVQRELTSVPENVQLGSWGGLPEELAEGFRMGAQAVRLSNVDIDKALKNKEFEVLFQPIFDLGNGALARMETFVRWRHAGLGVLPPGAFISFFETQGRMSELTRYVLAEALDAYIGWRGRSEPGFSINLAFSDLADDTFAGHYEKILRDRDFPSDLVTLECPMPPVDTDVEAAAAYFEKLRETGARLAIEVRGRANDLLRTIDPFPFDEIKTGGSAILRFARTVRGPGLSAISDLLELANKANAAITAVGVEDQASLTALRSLGFTAAQGNHLAAVGELGSFRPGRVNEVRELLGLEPLAADSLNALFRTEAPMAQPAEEGSATVTEVEPDPAPTSSNDENPEKSKKAIAREKAKALVLAKRAKLRESRKIAAINRAKEKAALSNDTTELKEATEEAEPQTSPAQEMRERLTKEFVETAPLDKEEKTQPSSSPKAPASTSPKANIDVPPAKETDSRPSVAPKAPMQSDDAKRAPKVKQETTKQAAPSLQTPQPAPSVKPQNRVSLSIAGAGAYFSPSLRVGAPALLPEAKASARRQEQPQPVKPSAAAKPAKPVQEELELQPAPQLASKPSPETKSAEAAPLSTAKTKSATESASLDELHIASDAPAKLTDHPVETTAANPTKKKKNILFRKYRIVSPYFWPRSWRRQWEEKKRAKQEDIANSEAAASMESNL